RLSGPHQWNRQQGFYVYRANRLIQSGGWSYLRTLDEHTKLSRIALMFTPELDAAFGINVAKMRVSLPHELRALIEDDVSTSARRARAVYDAKPDAPTAGARRGRTPFGPGSKSSRNGGSDGAALEPPARRAALEAAARAAEERRAFGRVVRVLKKRSPEV